MLESFIFRFYDFSNSGPKFRCFLHTKHRVLQSLFNVSSGKFQVKGKEYESNDYCGTKTKDQMLYSSTHTILCQSFLSSIYRHSYWLYGFVNTQNCTQLKQFNTHSGSFQPLHVTELGVKSFWYHDYCMVCTANSAQPRPRLESTQQPCSNTTFVRHLSHAMVLLVYMHHTGHKFCSGHHGHKQRVWHTHQVIGSDDISCMVRDCAQLPYTQLILRLVPNVPMQGLFPFGNHHFTKFHAGLLESVSHAQKWHNYLRLVIPPSYNSIIEGNLQFLVHKAMENKALVCCYSDDIFPCL